MSPAWSALLESVEWPLTMFLIILVLGLAWALWRIRTEHVTDLRSLVEAVERNTAALQHLRDLIDQMRRDR